jgi:hypothetical protein
MVMNRHHEGSEFTSRLFPQEPVRQGSTIHFRAADSPIVRSVLTGRSSPTLPTLRESAGELPSGPAINRGVISCQLAGLEALTLAFPQYRIDESKLLRAFELISTVSFRFRTGEVLGSGIRPPRVCSPFSGIT